MVAYKNNPASNRETVYKEHEYRLANPASSLPYLTRNSKPSCKRLSLDDECIDHVVRRSINNELPEYAPVNRNSIQNTPQYKYDLTQPIWFYRIIRKLADEGTNRN